MAEHARTLGMHVVLSDVRRGPLEGAVGRLRGAAGEGRVEGFVCDVTRPESVAALLASTTAASVCWSLGPPFVVAFYCHVLNLHFCSFLAPRRRESHTMTPWGAPLPTPCCVQLHATFLR